MHCQIQPFRPSCWNNMRGIACQEKATMLHLLNDETAHSDDAFLGDRAFL